MYGRSWVIRRELREAGRLPAMDVDATEEVAGEAARCDALAGPDRS
jgi:hypothetical protein